MKLSDITSNKKQVKQPVKQYEFGSLKYMLIHSSILNEDIIIATEKEYIKEIRQNYSGIVVYFVREILRFMDATNEELKKIHLLKKEFRGWVIPENRKDN